MDLLSFAVKVQQIAKIGLMYSKDPYAIENYEVLETLSREVLNDGHIDPAIEHNLFERNIYPTPSSSVRVLVFNSAGELLMVKEKQDGCWAVPGGWCEIYQGLQDNARKEVWEETGIAVKIGRLIGIFRREAYKSYPSVVSEYVHYFTAEPLTHDLRCNHETLDAAYFALSQLPQLSNKNTIKELTQALQVYQNGLEAYID